MYETLLPEPAAYGQRIHLGLQIGLLTDGSSQTIAKYLFPEYPSQPDLLEHGSGFFDDAVPGTRLAIARTGFADVGARDDFECAGIAAGDRVRVDQVGDDRFANLK